MNQRKAEVHRLFSLSFLFSLFPFLFSPSQTLSFAFLYQTGANEGVERGGRGEMTKSEDENEEKPALVRQTLVLKIALAETIWFEWQ